MTSDDFTPDDGVIRLFPLPNLVLFPGAMQPLHIFEPCYRQMTADALVGDRLIALALPRPGWEADYVGKPALHPVACVGRILAEQRLDDGFLGLFVWRQAPACAEEAGAQATEVHAGPVPVTPKHP